MRVHAVVGVMWVAGLLAMRASGAQTNAATQARARVDERVTQGALRIERPDGSIVECPLRHTDVKADVSGFIARVKVVQTFLNPLNEKIEAVYVFPLPHRAAVDGMTMILSERRVVGLIQRREAARQIYEEALRQGHAAALLEQERPNIFTQSVGNIEPAQEVRIEITYIDVLDYDMGTYTFHFPMVVGPRFIPGIAAAPPAPTPPELQGKTSGMTPPTDRVPDANRISPPVLKPDARNGHDIALALDLDAGVPIQDLKVVNHKAACEQTAVATAKVRLAAEDSIPNKDFEFRYKVVGKKPEMAVLCHTDRNGVGAFLLMVQPREDEQAAKAPPREIYFLVDVSGSMSGKPTEQVKRTMANLLRLCKAEDTLQVVTFAGLTRGLFDKAVPIEDASIEKALDFTRNLNAGGGTHMLDGVKRVMDAPADPKRMRIVIMLTDGFIGNEAEIIAEVGKRCGDRIRFWCLGIGTSVNRFLVDGVARQGGGMGKVLTLEEDSREMAQEIMARIHRAQLADIRIQWGAAPVYETYPARVPELWAGRPVVLFGRYEAGAKTTVHVRGTAEGEPVEWSLDVDFPAVQPANEVLAKVWARNKIEDLMQQTFYQGSPEVEEAATRVALEYGLMSPYTSFVAVDEKELAEAAQERARPPRRMAVPVPLPEGTSWAGFFGLGAALHGEGDARPGAEGKFEYTARHSGSLAPARSPAAVAGPAAPAKTARMTKGSPRAWGWGGPTGSAPGGGGKRQSPGFPADERRRQGMSRPLAPYSAPAVRAATLGLLGRLNRESPEGSIPTEMEDVGVARLVATNAADYAAAELFARVARRDATGQTERAGTAMAQARELRKAGRTDESRAWAAWACALSHGFENLTHGDAGEVPAQALALVAECDADQRRAWRTEVPALGTRIRLILRDRSVGQALSEIGAAAGLDCMLAEGSETDAEALGIEAVHVTYLDLTNVRASEALDWLTQPRKLEWRLEKTGDGRFRVRVGTARRLAGLSAWVYDVAAIAMPLPDELTGKDDGQRAEQAKQKIGQFLAALTAHLRIGADPVAWFEVGRIALFGDSDMHRAAADLFGRLANPKSEWPAEQAELGRLGARRAAARAGTVAKVREERARMALIHSMDRYGLRLLAAAAGGELDPEALAELQIAWRAPALPEAIRGEGAGIALRCAWAVRESASALQSSAELGNLAQGVRAAVRPAADQAVAALKQNPDVATAAFETLFAALALREDPAFFESVRPLLTREASSGPVWTLARALIAAPDAKDREALRNLMGPGLQGDDQVLLSALACRRAGFDLWEAFRAARREILGAQPLRGETVLVANRLDRLASGPGAARP